MENDDLDLDGDPDRDYEVFGVDASYQWNNLDLRGEYIMQDVADAETSVASEGGKWESWYLQSAYKFGSQQTLSAGYLWRSRPDTDHHRLMQQYSIVSRFPRFRLGHRLAADQTFRPNTPLEVRLRYRLSLELPLNGTQVDPGEWYLKINHEYLNAFQAQDYDLELRLIPVIGHLFSDRNKVETGVDWRVDRFIHKETRWTFWWAMAWYYSL